MTELEQRIQNEIDSGTLDPQSPKISPDKAKGLWIPSEILNDKDLTYAEQHLISYIYHLDQSDNDGMPCYAGNKWFGELMNMKPQSVANILTKLVSKNKIELLGFNGTYRFIGYKK